MAKKPTAAKPNFASFTKAELIRTIKTLDRRQTQLLNQIAKLETVIANRKYNAAIGHPHIAETPAGYPIPRIKQEAGFEVPDSEPGMSHRAAFPWEK